MSGNLSGFDANNVQPSDFDVLPAGEYEVVIVKSEKKATKSGNGAMLSLELQVLNGPYQNRKLFDNLNLWNQNETAAKIAKASLSAICRAVGVMTPNDSTDLHNKPLRVKVKVEKSDEYDDRNKIVAYKPRNAAPVSQGPQTTTAELVAHPW